MNVKLAIAHNWDGTISGVSMPGEAAFSGRLDLLLIKAAWNAGVSFEDLCDGLGVGAGTNGDWSAIRDSSEPAIIRMLERVLNTISFAPSQTVKRRRAPKAGK